VRVQGKGGKVREVSSVKHCGEVLRKGAWDGTRIIKHVLSSRGGGGKWQEGLHKGGAVRGGGKVLSWGVSVLKEQDAKRQEQERQ